MWDKSLQLFRGTYFSCLWLSGSTQSCKSCDHNAVIDIAYILCATTYKDNMKLIARLETLVEEQ